MCVSGDFCLQLSVWVGGCRHYKVKVKLASYLIWHSAVLHFPGSVATGRNDHRLVLRHVNIAGVFAVLLLARPPAPHPAYWGDWGYLNAKTKIKTKRGWKGGATVWERDQISSRRLLLGNFFSSPSPPTPTFWDCRLQTSPLATRREHVCRGGN